MKKSIKQILSVFLSVCLIFSCFTFGGASVVNASQEDDRAELQQKLDKIDAKLDELKKEKSDTQEYINALDERLGYLRQQYNTTEQEAKEIFDAVLENRALPAQKNIVLANAAFGIQVMEKGKKSIDECVEIARESINSGKALATFKKFVELNS